MDSRGQLTSEILDQLPDQLENLSQLLDIIMKRIDVLENQLRPIPDGKANWTFYNLESKEQQQISIGQVVCALVHPQDCLDCKNGTHQKQVAH